MKLVACTELLQISPRFDHINYYKILFLNNSFLNFLVKEMFRNGRFLINTFFMMISKPIAETINATKKKSVSYFTWKSYKFDTIAE